MSSQRKRKKLNDQGKTFGALLTDLSKAFNFFDLELHIAKLNTCGFNLLAFKLIHDYLSNKSKEEPKSVPRTVTDIQSFSIPAPLLFNIFLEWFILHR